MQLNHINVIDRHERPNVINKVLLRSFFINDGAMQDPYQISSVNIFYRPVGSSPSSVLNSDNLVAESKAGDAKMCFQPSSTGIVFEDTGNPAPQFAVSTYTGQLAPFPIYDEMTGEVTEWEHSQPCSGVSGIYRIGEGEYGLVLDGILNGELSGVSDEFTEEALGIYGNIHNTASAATTYTDIWTVKLTKNSPWTTVINNFELFTDTFYTLTEPPIISTNHKLMNSRIKLGSKIQLKVVVDLTLQNRNIDSSLKNIFKNMALHNAKFKIMKVDQQADSFPSRVTILDFGGSAPYGAVDPGTGLPEMIEPSIDVTSDNTLLLFFDTELSLRDFPPKDLATPVGTYSVEVEYDLLRETIRSPLMFFMID